MKRMNDFRNMKIETLSPDELGILQEGKLRKQMEHVYEKSAFYQRKFKQAGVVPGEIRSIEDLQKIPFTTKEELRESQAQHPPLGFHMAAPMDKIIHEGLLRAKLVFRADVHLVPEGSLPRYEIKAQFIQKLWES